MKGMPLPFDFEGKGVLDLDLILKKNQSFLLTNNFSSTDFAPNNHCFLQKDCIFETSNNSFGSGEPTSVLGPTSSSTTLSSSHGGGGGGSAAVSGGVATGCGAGGGGSTDTTNPSPKWQQESNTATSSSNVGNDIVIQMGTNVGCGNEKFTMEDWETVLSDVSHGQEQLRWIMGGDDAIEDPNVGSSLNKVLQLGVTGNNDNNNYGFGFDFNNAGFGIVDHESFGLGGVGFIPNIQNLDRSNPLSSSNLTFLHNISPLPNANNLCGFNGSTGFDSCSVEAKPHLFNSELLINNHQAQQTPSSSFLFPFPYEPNLFLQPPQAKRHNPGVGVIDSLGEMSKGSFSLDQQRSSRPHQLQFLPHYQGPVKIGNMKIGEDFNSGQCNNNPQQTIVDQLFKASELVQTGNIVLAQSILARLNHQLSRIDNKPFNRVAFYCKEALQLLLSSSNNNNDATTVPNSSPFTLVFKIGAYKSFSEISPVVQFTNFTCNQAVLEAVEGFDRIHVVDFDIGYGGQWASLMQELALRNGVSTSMKITVIASPLTHNELELGLMRENLIQFASDINILFEFEVVTFDSLNSGSWALPNFHASENKGIVVNLPVSVLASQQLLSLAMVLRFVKQLSPKIIVSVDRGCDRTDVPFASHVIHALQSHTNLLESLDAVNVNVDALHRIEKFLLQPGIEKIVTSRFRSMEKTQHWRSLFLSSGFSPVPFSNFAESQAECVIKRTPVRGFTVEKRQSCLVLCWQRKELVSCSAWRC